VHAASAEHITVREARQYKVVGITATTGKEARISVARHRLAQREFHRKPSYAFCSFSTTRADIFVPLSCHRGSALSLTTIVDAGDKDCSIVRKRAVLVQGNGSVPITIWLAPTSDQVAQPSGVKTIES